MTLSPSCPHVVDAERLDSFADLAASNPLPGTPPHAKAQCLIAAARILLATLERGQRLDASCLRAAMVASFGGSDGAGFWDWKAAYEAVEAATILFLRKFGPGMRQRARTPAAMLGLLTCIGDLLPTHTRRSEESLALQQFSTPIDLGFAASVAAAITPTDLVLEPSAGTGLLAIMAELGGAALRLNEIAETRADMLAQLFGNSPLTRFDAARIDDYLGDAARPSVVLMNPPFSVVQHVEQRRSDAALRHIASALDRLIEGGRLVAITGANCSPHHAAWRGAFEKLQARGRIVFTCAIAGTAYARHGTSFETRLTVIDRQPAEDPTSFPAHHDMASDAAMLLKCIEANVPARLPFVSAATVATVATIAPRTSASRLLPSRPSVTSASPNHAPAVAPAGIELAYETRDWTAPEGEHLTEALYEDYALQAIIIPGAIPHPTRLVQSAAMASVTPPKPSYRPRLPEEVISRGLLSDAQLESIILAGEAHQQHLGGCWSVNETFDKVIAVPEDSDGALRFRKGWFLGDGTGAGKGRQAAGIVLDNWLHGRRRALWVSKSDKLMEDAQRDWAALGQERLQITPLSRFAQGVPVRLQDGILFTTYATLRSEGRGTKASRLDQIVQWLGSAFDGVIIFDESHAMQNAAGGTNERGETEGSQQGRAGLRLQHALPDARVVYVSATGATSVHNLAYAQRLGLWGGTDFPFATREEFVGAIEAGGVAAMEVLARDMKALGLYSARSLSLSGVTYEPLEHQLTPAQVRIYDAYAGAFAIIHNNLNAALEASGVTSGGGTLNRQAKAAARSAFESAKQRFFNHLITAMKIPSLIVAIEHDLKQGHACVIQIVSTSEALMERRLALIPSCEWNDLSIDITPREYVLDYLANSFPTQLYEPFTDEDGKVSSRPVFIDGQPVPCREAEARRDRLIEKLASLAPVPGALDQIVQHFGTGEVAEITGRARRIIRKRGSDGFERLMVENRAGSANLAETQAFMNDAKRILIFSDAGGTGRSYHADLSAKNQRLRVHYLLEPGWKADAAIQGLGRTNRTNQAQPPLFRPVMTNVKGEKRFVSTIARRLDTLGAITRGQRQTGGQGLFRASDNLEGFYARAALRQLYQLLVMSKIAGCSLGAFEAATGLTLTDANGLKDELPPITTFLNRLLALTLGMQDILFTAFEHLLNARIESAHASGHYDVGLETLAADSLRISERKTIYTHAGTSAATELLTITQRLRNKPLSLEGALGHRSDLRARLLVNSQSGRAAVQVPAPSLMLDDGEVEKRVRLLRPLEQQSLPLETMPDTHWREVDEVLFAQVWTKELLHLPEFTESQFKIVCGLLLPIWKRLPEESTRVYRLQTDDGQRIIGRLVPDAFGADFSGEAPPALLPDEVFAALQAGESSFVLENGLVLQQRRIMNAARLELTGFEEGMVEPLKAMGLFSEIIAWKLRLFIPHHSGGSLILTHLLDRYPLISQIGRAA